LENRGSKDDEMSRRMWEAVETGIVSKSKKVDLIYFIFDLFFYFLFLEQLGLGLIGHAVTSVT